MKKNELTKVQKIQHIMTITGVAQDTIAMEYLKNELELLKNRREGNGDKAKEKKALMENLKLEVLDILENATKSMTATEITKAMNSDVSVQRIVSILRRLIEEDNMVERVMVKKTPYFALKTKVETAEEVEEAIEEVEEVEEEKSEVEEEVNADGESN